MTARLASLGERLAGRVPAEILDEFLDYVHVGEPKLAVEALCDALYDAEIPLLSADVEAIQAAGVELGITRRSLSCIAELVTDQRQ
jgi:hypothetical protein